MKKTKQPAKGVVPSPKTVAPYRAYREGILIWIAAAIVVALAFPISHNGFVYDDAVYIQGNQLIRHWDIISMFAQPVLGTRAGIYMLLCTIEYYLFGLDPIWWHLTSLVLHTSVSLLAFFLSRRIFRASGLANANRLALLASFLFAVHPMRVESVVWASEQKDLLYGIFYIAGLICYLRYRETSKAKGAKLLWFATGLFILSCLSKGMAVTFPIVILLLDAFIVPYSDRRAFLGSLPWKMGLLVISILVGIDAVHAQHSSQATGFIHHSWANQIMFSCVSFWKYIGMFFIPIDQAVLHLYPLPDSSGCYPAPYYLAPVGIALLIVAFAAATWKFRASNTGRIVLFGIAFFAANVVLVLQFKSVGYAMWAERYTYLAYLGLVISFVGVMSRIKNGQWIIFVVACGWIVIAREYSKIFHDEFQLWNRVASIHNGSFEKKTVPLFALAQASYQNGEIEEAKRLCFQALKADSGYALALNFRGVLYEIENKADSARIFYRKAMRASPPSHEAFTNLAAFYQDENSDSALILAEAALRISPESYLAHNTKGVFFAKRGSLKKAIAEFDSAIILNERCASCYHNRAKAFHDIGNNVRAGQDQAKSEELGWK